MSRGLRRVVAVAPALLLAAPARAQSTAEYSRRVDSLARVWRVTVATETARDTLRARNVPTDSLRAGPVIVRPDSQWIALGRETAEHLAPAVVRAYGQFAERLARHEFVLRDRGGGNAGVGVLSGVADSTGIVTLRSADYANSDALLDSWKHKAASVISDEAGPEIRRWIQANIPIDPPSPATWSDAKVALVLSPSVAAADCVRADLSRCAQVLGLVPIDDPAFVLFDASARLGMIRDRADLLRRANPALFDRCTISRQESACDSIVRTIPPNAVPEPVSPMVRQSFARFALALGGDGAFDRFMAADSRRARIEAASRLPVDSVVSQWRATLLDSPRSSTALNVETAVSSLVWAAVCGALALRSSRWR